MDDSNNYIKSDVNQMNGDISTAHNENTIKNNMNCINASESNLKKNESMQQLGEKDLQQRGGKWYGKYYMDSEN